MDNTLDDILMHYGMPRRSGRYPWGSGENPYQHSGDFLSRVKELRKNNFTFTDPEDGKTYTGDLAIAKSMKLSSTEFRVAMSIANSERRKLEVDRAKSLRADGKSLNEIADIMGYKNDSSIRSLLNENSEARMNQAQATADILRRQINEKGMIDVGAGVERQLGVSREKLNEALTILEMEGYPVYGGGIPQATNPGKQTNVKVVCPLGTKHADIYKFDQVHSIKDFVSHDDGETFDPKWVYPESMDSKRLMVRYGNEGGNERDGVIEIRRGVPDLDLGESRYAQVRIMVDGTHYLKGMAVYADDLPEGVDVRFNTNKNADIPVMGPKDNTILKPIKKDPSNPFGSLIKEGIVDPDDPTKTEGGQSYYYDKDGNKKLSLINKRAEEGDWGEWSNKLPSQFLSKQKQDLIDKQLNLAIADKELEFSEINSLTNSTVKKAMLMSFAEDCDSAAVHLHAAALPRQQYQVILPLTDISDKEVYAPNYRDGETVALIRYPHGGTFEIPILKVNNKLKEGMDILGKNPIDGIGISKNVADRLSGADFDGDTVMVIPCNNHGSKVKITSTPELEGLKGFDAKLEYGGKKEGTYQRMTSHGTQLEMGKISNLITDMTLKGASNEELARAVRHSMVVIDAEKHGLDYKQSEKDNGIAALKKKYQGRIEDGKYREGASTLISRAKAEYDVPKRRGSADILEDGSLSWKTAYDKDLYYVDKKGRTKMRMQKSTQMAETPDPYTLSSGIPQEEAYANYALKMKSMANEARKIATHTPDIKMSPAAKQTYAKEVSSLNSQLNVALLNAPRERQAQMMANSVVSAKVKENPDMNKKEIKKAKQQALTAARTKVGAKRSNVEISDKEWEAIQSGAISANVLNQIIAHTDKDKLRQLATPRATTQLSEAKQSKIRMMRASGYTNAEIADTMNVSTSTVNKYLK